MNIFKFKIGIIERTQNNSENAFNKIFKLKKRKKRIVMLIKSKSFSNSQIFEFIIHIKAKKIEEAKRFLINNIPNEKIKYINDLKE